MPPPPDPRPPGPPPPETRRAAEPGAQAADGTDASSRQGARPCPAHVRRAGGDGDAGVARGGPAVRSAERSRGPGPTGAPSGPAVRTPGGGTAASPGGASTVRKAADTGFADAEELLGGYLRGHAAQTLRALRWHREADGSAAGAADAVRELRRSARRLSAALLTFRGCLDRTWADRTRGELAWLAATLSHEYVHAARQERLSAALQRLAEAAAPADRAAAGREGGRNALSAGAARAGALLERRLTLARTRAHSAALRALGSARFHAVADAIAVLASEAPLDPATAGRSAHRALFPLAEQARRRLVGAVGALPPAEAAREDAAWHHVRLLLQLHRYAQEVVERSAGAQVSAPAARILDRHRDAAEAAAAAAAAAATPRIAPSTAYALGVLHADQRHQVEAARLAFAAQWGAE